MKESKNVHTTPSAPTASAVGPCPTVIQIVGRPGTGSLPSTIATPPRKEKRKNVTRPGIEPKPFDLPVRCPTNCAMRPGLLK